MARAWMLIAFQTAAALDLRRRWLVTAPLGCALPANAAALLSHPRWKLHYAELSKTIQNPTVLLQHLSHEGQSFHMDPHSFTKQFVCSASIPPTLHFDKG